MTLAPWKKNYDQPREHIKKQRHYFTNKGLSSQSSGFSIVMYGGESWTIKKAEHQRTDAFELWCWRRLLRVPWTARRSSQSILKEIGPDYSLEGLILRLKLQYFGHLMWRTKEPIDESERGEWKSWLKAQHSENEDNGIWSHHFMANRWETMETMKDFTFSGSKITEDGDCSHEIKTTLAPWKKSYDQPRQHI